MNNPELQKEISMSYDELCNYLKIKYGAAPCDYFPNPMCKARRPKIGRGLEGLYCHHIDEDKGGNLSGAVSARNQPFAWQKAERLVYCNLIEHLILHVKIAIMRQKDVIVDPFWLNIFFTTQGINQISAEIITLFFRKGGEKEWNQRCYDVIKDDIDSYITIINTMLCYLDGLYIGKRDHRTKIPLSVLNSSPNETAEERFNKNNLCLKLSFADWMEVFRVNFSSTSDGDVLPYVYNRIQTESFDEDIKKGSQLISVDFNGYGFPQFNRIFLNKENWGSQSLDEYISKAFPSKYTPINVISKNKPKFWRGELPEVIIDRLIKNNIFFIIRIKTSFSILPDCEPFIYDRNTWKYGVVDDDNNFLRKTGILVQSCVSPIIVTLTKDDYMKFRENYHINSMICLDGICWE